jgi:formiminoglutamase
MVKIVKIKSSQGSLGKNIGTENAPDLILKGIKSSECKIVQGNLEETNKFIEQQEGDLFVGGDHSITYPIFRNFSRKYKGKNIGLIVFDAHADCTNNFLPPTHEDFIKVLIEEGTLKKENLMQIGLRNIDPVEQEFLDKKKINYILMKDIKKDNAIKALLEKIKGFAQKLEVLYLSIDIDILDEKYAMGTGYPEKNGMSLEDLLFLLKEIKKFSNLKRIDLVEVNPIKDKDNITMKSAKEILKVII